jgi:hypothetical protein
MPRAKRRALDAVHPPYFVAGRSPRLNTLALELPGIRRSPLNAKASRWWWPLPRLDPDNLLRASLCGIALFLCGNTDHGNSSVAKEARRRPPEGRLSESYRSNRPRQLASLALARRFRSRRRRDGGGLQSIQEIEKPIRHWLGNDIGVKAA